MRAKVIFAAFALAFTPGLALAACSGYGHDQVTMSCPDGQTFDAATQSCTASPTG